MHTTTHTTPPSAFLKGQRPASQENHHPVIKKLLLSRGLSEQEIEEFFSWDLKALPDLTQMKDLRKASARIIQAMDQNETIGIYGDYDVDGTTSCALFYHFFRFFNIDVELIQPSRFIEGYGLHPSSIDTAIDKNIRLLITVDCGITNVEAAEYAKLRGLDLIITDHHKDAREEMPEAFAIINPNRRDEPKDSPLAHLAGVAVAFAVCWQIKKDLESLGRECPSLYPLLQFVAIGTICDLAKLTPMNLKLVRHGLKQIPQTNYPGIRAFFTPEERKLNFVPSEKLSFGIGPLINSKGRLDHPEKALKLLIAPDSQIAYECYSQLEISNKERKFIQNEVFKSAKEQVLQSLDGQELLASIVYQEDWHEGVIGIVASKLVETFKVPAFIFTDSEEQGIIKASARSAGDLNVFECLNELSDLYTKFGGHKAAAGLSMPKENFPDFYARMKSILKQIPAIERTVQDFYDLEISPEEITPQLLKELEMLEPFGKGNEKPLFKMKGFELESYDILKDVHVRWSLHSPSLGKRLRGISFNYIGKWNAIHPQELYKLQNNQGQELCAYFTLGINRFNGNEYIQLMIERFEVGQI